MYICLRTMFLYKTFNFIISFYMHKSTAKIIYKLLKMAQLLLNLLFLIPKMLCNIFTHVINTLITCDLHLLTEPCYYLSHIMR